MRASFRMRVWMVALALLFGAFPAIFSGQSVSGTIVGNVADQNGASVRGASVRLANRLTGYRVDLSTNDDGEFAFHNVPFAVYELTVLSSGFADVERSVIVTSNVPIRISVALSVGGASAEVTVDSPSSEGATQTATQISAERIRALPIVRRTGALQAVVATTSGITTQNNGLLHVRGIEDGMLYVIDGVPQTDRIDLSSASGPDIGEVRSLEVITGNFPAEFGGRSGAVAVVQARSGIDERVSGEFTASTGNFSTSDIAARIGAGWRQKFGIFANAAALRTDRYLDAVDPRNFDAHGIRRNFAFRADWQPSDKDSLVFGFGANAARFDVPNDEIQQLAGQRQRQRFGDDNESVSWQRGWNSRTVTNLILFRRRAESRLLASDFDTPITATQDRRQTRMGALGSVTILKNGHAIKGGFETTHIRAREHFSFAVTDDKLAEEREVSDEAREFTPDNPFVFNGARNGRYTAVFIQDRFTVFDRLSINAGLRFDHSELPATDNQLSPRVGAAYHFPSTGTTIRASFNRLFQPPQIENLLLSDSNQARALSPFAKDGTGGERVRAERVSAYEIGGTQNIRDAARFDVAFWRRNFRNFGDPNTFFNTTIVFPNSVAKGFARGFDVRLDILERRGFSGYASWTNARILQTGPINGGLFLTDEFVEIGPGTRFIPDHDQRNVASFAVTYSSDRRRWYATFGGRHESGVPLEVEEERLEELMNAPGAETVDFERSRVRPWTIFNLQVGAYLIKKESRAVRLEANMENIFDHKFAYNFGSPFEGTHFGAPRMFSGRLIVSLR